MRRQKRRRRSVERRRSRNPVGSAPMHNGTVRTLTATVGALDHETRQHEPKRDLTVVFFHRTLFDKSCNLPIIGDQPFMDQHFFPRAVQGDRETFEVNRNRLVWQGWACAPHASAPAARMWRRLPSCIRPRSNGARRSTRATRRFSPAPPIQSKFVPRATPVRFWRRPAPPPGFGVT